jgi:hypothetical protein
MLRFHVSRLRVDAEAINAQVMAATARESMETPHIAGLDTQLRNV